MGKISSAGKDLLAVLPKVLKFIYISRRVSIARQTAVYTVKTPIFVKVGDISGFTVFWEADLKYIYPKKIWKRHIVHSIRCG
jgi:hypothetical protein